MTRGALIEYDADRFALLAETAEKQLAQRLTLPTGVRLTRTGLEGLRFDLTSSEFIDMTEVLLDEFELTAVKGHTLNWAIGDALAQGEKRFGDAFMDALQDRGIPYETLNVARWVAGNIPKAIRKPPPVT